jgi:hypothetical protein
MVDAMRVTLKSEVFAAWWVRWYIYALIVMSWLGIQPNVERAADRIMRGARVRVVAVPPEE